MSLLNGTMTPIQTITVGSGGQATIEFTNIPQTYTDLCILLSARQSSTGGTNVNMKFNGSSINYTNKDMISAAGNAISEGTVLGTSSIKIGFIPDNTNYTTSTFSNQYIHISNYASSNSKSVSTDNAMENNSTSVYFGFFSGLWSDASAITSIALTPENGSFVQHSTATLYGIAKYTGETGGKAIGGVVTSDANYWYHTFTNSGMFTPTQSLTADYLLIGGGGAGGNAHGPGGGGAGGHQYLTGQNLTTQSYTVLIGAGGGISDSNTVPGNPGSPSTFAGTTAGGGGGGREYLVGTGGSSGSPQSLSGGSGAVSSYSERGGGGAGTSSAGTNATSTTGGNGGNGTANSITGTSVTGAGGGAGGGARDTASGSPGTGGGGAGGIGGGVPASPGAQYTGSGGGGGRDGAGGNGGSGILIIRYAK